MTIALVSNLADVDWVRKEMVERAARERFAAAAISFLGDLDYRDEPPRFKIVFQSAHVPQLEVALKDALDDFGFLVVQHQFAVAHLVSHGRCTADPHPLAFGSGDLVADALADDLTFELGEGQQYVQGQPP